MFKQRSKISIQIIKIWKEFKPIVEINEKSNDENISLILISRVKRGFAIESNIKMIVDVNFGIKAIIELIKPMKLKIPIKGTTAIFANKLNGARLLK